MSDESPEATLQEKRDRWQQAMQELRERTGFVQAEDGWLRPSLEDEDAVLKEVKEKYDLK